MIVISSPGIYPLELPLLAGFGDEIESNIRNAERKQEGHPISLHVGYCIVLHDGLELGEPPVCKLVSVNLGIRITHYSNQQIHAHNAEEKFV